MNPCHLPAPARAQCVACARDAPPGRMRHARGQQIARHPHRQAFAALALSCHYVEAGDTGLHRVAPGEVVFHAAHERHLDRFGCAGAEVLVLPLDDRWHGAAHARVVDPDRIARVAERDIAAAVCELQGHAAARRRRGRRGRLARTPCARAAGRPRPVAATLGRGARAASGQSGPRLPARVRGQPACLPPACAYPRRAAPGARRRDERRAHRPRLRLRRPGAHEPCAARADRNHRDAFARRQTKPDPEPNAGAQPRPCACSHASIAGMRLSRTSARYWMLAIAVSAARREPGATYWFAYARILATMAGSVDPLANPG